MSLDQGDEPCGLKQGNRWVYGGQVGAYMEAAQRQNREPSGHLLSHLPPERTRTESDSGFPSNPPDTQTYDYYDV